MQKTRESTEKLEIQIEDWTKKLEDLRRRRQLVSERARNEYDRQLHLMHSKLETLKQKLRTHLQQGHTTADLDNLSEKVLHEIDDAFNSAISKLN